MCSYTPSVSPGLRLVTLGAEILQMRKLLICFVACGALIGCGKWPEIVDSVKDVEALPSTITSIRARGLPDGAVASLARLTNLVIIDFNGGSAVGPARITDRGIAILASLQLLRLETLTLGQTEISDDALADLAKMETVRWLSLSACQKVTDRGILNLLAMTNLSTLDLRGCTNITDTGILHLSRMGNLKEVLLGGTTRTTSNGVEQLRLALPTCKVGKDDHEWSGHGN